MILRDIYLFVKDRAGETNEDYILRQINNVIQRTWLTTDLPGSLYEMTVDPTTERIMILPWYVFQLKAVRRAGTGEVTLYTPRAWYQANGGYQYPLQWVEMEPTPLLRSYNNIGRLRLRLSAPATVPFTATVTGPGEFGTKIVQDCRFSVGDTEQTTEEVVNDLLGLGKSIITEQDIRVFDVTNTCIAVLPADRTGIWNKKVRITDQQSMPAVFGTCNRFSVLYKTQPPVFTSFNEPIDMSMGQIIQNFVVADILSKSSETADMNRMKFHGSTAIGLLDEAVRRENEGKLQPVGLSRDPFTHEYFGWL